MSIEVPINIHRCARCGEVQWLWQAEFPDGSREILVNCGCETSEMVYKLKAGEVPVVRLETVEQQPVAETEEKSDADHGEGDV